MTLLLADFTSKSLLRWEARTEIWLAHHQELNLSFQVRSQGRGGEGEVGGYRVTEQNPRLHFDYYKGKYSISPAAQLENRNLLPWCQWKRALRDTWAPCTFFAPKLPPLIRATHSSTKALIWQQSSSKNASFHPYLLPPVPKKSAGQKDGFFYSTTGSLVPD